MCTQSSAALAESECTPTAPGSSGIRAKREASTAPSVVWTAVRDDQPLSDDAIRALAALLLESITEEEERAGARAD